jgi:2-dehydro-3-deoxygluconokinase
MVELSCTGRLTEAVDFKRSFGGDAFNTAVAAARLGSPVRFFTRLGKDPFAEGLRALMTHEGLPTKPLKTIPGYTGLYFAAVQPDGQREFVYYRQGSAASTLRTEDLPPSWMKEAKVVFATGVSLAISPSCRQTVLSVFQQARAQGIITAFDPNYRSRLWESPNDALDALNEILPYVDVILPSIPEDTRPVIGFDQPQKVIEYFWLKDVKLVVVKAGPDGCFLGYKKQVEYLPARSSRVVDTTGAGDAFNGGFLHGLLQQLPLTQCAQLGLITAALKLQQPGAMAGLPYRDEVYQEFRSII